MARPTKSDAEKRTAQIALRLTDAEAEHLRLQAGVAGISVSDYVRRRALGHRVQASADQRQKAQLIREINSVGVLCNQLARATGRGRRFTTEWDGLAGKVREAMAKVVLSHGA